MDFNPELIYKSEYEILEQLQVFIANKNNSKQEFSRELELLGKKYLKLLKTTVKITKISDAYQKKLMVAKEQAEQKSKELEEAVAKIETLSGLLPICSNCKQIRDEKGDWNQIESYIANHSSAEFSHSLCPVCFKHLYPRYSDKI